MRKMRRCRISQIGLLLGLALSPVPLAAQAAPALPALEVSATLSRSVFLPLAEFDKGLIVIVEDSAGHRVSGATVEATVGGGPVGFYTTSGGATTPKATQTTSADGTATFNLATQKVEDAADDFFILLTAKPPAGTAAAPGNASVQGDIGAGFDDSFHSDRVSSEVFVGGTFARAYGEDGESTGFDETSAVGIFRVDTLYRPTKGWAALHTGLELQFSSFPTTEQSEDSNGGDEGTFNTFADAYTGALVVVLQPDRLTSYSDTAHNERAELRYDAFKHGFIARVGVTSRAEKQASNMDTDILHARVGYLFTHHQTRAPKPQLDRVNVFPMRFVEISGAYYESIFNQRNAKRLVVEAGLRLPGLGNDAVPFYAGLYLNAGEGQDDFRVFAGLLFRLDRIPQVFR